MKEENKLSSKENAEFAGTFFTFIKKEDSFPK